MRLITILSPEDTESLGTTGCGCLLGLALIIAVVGVFQAVGKWWHTHEERVAVAEEQRLDVEDPNRACRQQIADALEDHVTPAEFTVRDTVPGSYFRFFAYDRMLDGSHWMTVLIAKDTVTSAGTEPICSSAFGENVAPDGSVEYPPNEITRAFHALLQRRGIPHPAHPIRHRRR